MSDAELRAAERAGDTAKVERMRARLIVTVVTRDNAPALSHGTTLYHVTIRNRDKTPLRVRVSGECHTWKTRPTEFRVPVKYGMYENGYVTHLTGDQWRLTEVAALQAEPVMCRECRVPHVLGADGGHAS